MDEPASAPPSATSESNGEQSQQDTKTSWPDFMTVQYFLADAPYGSMKTN